MKAKRAKKYYKNESAWLDAVYRNNKSTIDMALEGVMGSKKTVFKNLVQEYKDEGLSSVKALKTLSKSTIFVSEAERMQQNIYKGIKSHKMLQEFRQAIGWHNKVDVTKFKYEGNNTYRYENVVINVSNSPENISFEVEKRVG